MQSSQKNLENLSKDKQDTLFVTSLEKGMRILDAFDEEHPELGLAELAKVTGLEKSAAQRFSNTLHKLGFLQKDPITKRFRPSIKMLEFSYSYLWSDTLVQLAMPKLIELADAINGTVNMSILDGSDIVYVVRLPSRRSNFSATIIGRRVPALNTSSGRAMLSLMPEKDRRHFVEEWPLKKFTNKTTLDRVRILELVEEASVKGYSPSDSELINNELGIAAPIISSDGRPLAAVQCSLSRFNNSAEKIENEVLPLLLETPNSPI